MSDTIKGATYKKLRSGDWGVSIRNDGLHEPKVGAQVEVITKAGKVKLETISKIVYVGSDVWLCAIGREAERSPTGSGFKCGSCGADGDPDQTYCWECGAGGV